MGDGPVSINDLSACPLTVTTTANLPCEQVGAVLFYNLLSLFSTCFHGAGQRNQGEPSQPPTSWTSIPGRTGPRDHLSLARRLDSVQPYKSPSLLYRS